MSRMDCIIAPRVPRGLSHAVEGLSREILRQKPRNIYAFAAQHFAKLVELRDKERCRTDEIVSKILDCKSVNREISDNILDWAGFNKNMVDGDNGDVRNWNDHFFVCKYGNWIMEKEMTSTIKERSGTNVMPKKKKREMGTGIGWSMNQTVKVLKKHEYATCHVEESENILCDTRSKRREIEKTNPDHIDHCTHQFSRKIICGQCFRSMSADNISLRRDIKDEEVEEKRKKLRNFALDKYGINKMEGKCEKCERNACNLIRQKSVDQIERTCIHFKCGNGNGNIVGRRRSRSLVNNEGGKESNGNVEEYRRAQRWQYRGIEGGMFRNLKEQWKRITIEDEETEMHKLEEKLSDTEKEDVAKLSLRLGKKYEKEELKNDETKENTFNDKSRNNEISNDATSIDRIDISVVLPSVVTRPPSSGKSSTGRNVANYEFDEWNNTNNFTLPPISSDGSKPIKKENDLIELPFLSNETDIRLNEETMLCRGREESSSNRNRKDVEVIANIDSKAIEKEYESENSKSDANDDNDSWKYHWHKCEENGLVTEEKMERNTDEIRVLEELEILEDSNLRIETEIEETFKDSLNVTPDSLEYLKQEEKEMKEGEEEKQEQYRSNELERKLMEIETVEKSIENTLASSRTISTFNKELEESCSIKCNRVERNLESQVLENVCKTDNENDTIIVENETRGQAACEEDEWTRKNLDKNESVRGESEGYDIEIESVEKFQKNCPDDVEIFVKGDDNNEIVRGTCDHSSRGEIDLSCYVLTEGSPCEIPEIVTTVIIPDKNEFEMDGENITNDIVRNDVPCWNKREKEYRDNRANPFGEYVEHSETIDNDRSSSVHAHFLQDIKNTVYRTSSLYQEDLLGNIKEEEENEREKFCNVAEHSIDYTGDSSQAKPPNDEERYKVDTTNDTFRVFTNDASLREKGKKEEGETWRSDRWDEFSSSFEQTGLKVSEFSVNCSRETVETSTSSSIQGNDSRNFDDDDRSGKGNDDDVTLYVDESAFITCKDKQPIEEISLEKNEYFREELFIEQQPPKDETIEETKRNKIETSKFEDDISIDMPVVCDKYGNDSRSVEEEIARELIENFILDPSIIWENIESRNMAVFPVKDPISSTCKSSLNDFAIKFHPSVQESRLETTIDHLSHHREEIDNDIRSCDEQIIKEKKKNEIEGRKNEQEASEKKEEKEKASILFHI